MQGGAATNPRLLQMRDAERQLRAMGEIEAADMLRQQIEEQERAGAQFAEPQLGNMTQDNMTPPMPENMMMSSGMGMIPSTARVAAQPTTTDIVRQAEMLELQTTVESLRSEIASMREEIRSLEALLRQANQLPASEVPAPVSLGE